MNVYEAVGRLVIAGVLDLLKGLLTPGPPRTSPAPAPPPAPPPPPGRKRSARNEAPERRRKKR